MSNVMNRKMFRPRNARNKLNQMGGIMASSPELINTVSTYRRGGPILGPTSPVQASRSPTGPRFSGGQNPNYGLGMIGYGLRGYQPDISASDFMALPVSDQRKFIEAENRRRALQRPASAAQLPFRGIVDLISNAGAGIGNLVTSGAQSIGLLDPTADLSIRGTGLTSSGVDLMQKFPELKGTEEEQVDQYAALLATDRGELQDPNIMRAVDEQAVKMQALEDQREKEGDIMSQYPSKGVRDPFTTDLGGEEAELGMPTSGKEAKRATREGDGAARDKGLAPMAASDPQIIAAKKGELGPKAQVEAVIRTGTQEEQQEQLKQLMAEFTQNAPEYEGMDKGLAIAKIGFAMASGQSPSALTNIASALEQGADMFLKDKKDRDSFNRQIKLSALQYGMGEISKERAEDRITAREGRKLTYWVADSDITFNGKNYSKGETVAVPNSYILENGLPSELQLPEMAKAAMELQEAGIKALAKAAKEGVMKPEDYRKNSEAMTQAATDFSTSNKLGEILNSQIFSVAEGNVTGLSSASASFMNKAANAVGVDLGKKFESKEAYDTAMQKVANQLVNDLLGEGSKTMSDMDRRLAQEIVGYYGAGLFDYAFADPDVLLDKLQSTLVEVENKNRRSLNTMRDIMDASVGYSFKSGQPVRYREALSVAGPYLTGGQQKEFGLEQGEDGVFRIAQPK